MADFDAKTHFAPLTPGQFHFSEGLYVGSPTTPEGLPPGDGALLATHDGDKGGVIIWTRGPLACSPIAINEKLVKLISDIKTGHLDSEGNERESRTNVLKPTVVKSIPAWRSAAYAKARKHGVRSPTPRSVAPVS